MIYADHSKEKTVLCGYFSEDSDVDKDFYLEVDTAENHPTLWTVYLCHKYVNMKISMFGRSKEKYTQQDMLDMTSEEKINSAIKQYKHYIEVYLDSVEKSELPHPVKACSFADKRIYKRARWLFYFFLFSDMFLI